jgi:hypothetical protein
MQRLLIATIWLSTAGITARAQHGHGAGIGGHGASPVFDAPSSPATRAAGGNAQAGSSANSASMAAPHNFAARLSANPATVARIQPLIPAGMTLSTAAAGFRNQGQFLAALNVAHNLNIPFSQLKAQMTGPANDSLGQAIHALRPNLSKQSVKQDVRVATREAQLDLHASAATSAVIASRINANPNLSMRITALLPKGMSLQAAVAGFRNEGQFLATLHAAHDLNISFTNLQTRIAGGQSLGQAIAALQPGMSPATVRTEVRTAFREAHADTAQTST